MNSYVKKESTEISYFVWSSSPKFLIPNATFLNSHSAKSHNISSLAKKLGTANCYPDNNSFLITSLCLFKMLRIQKLNFVSHEFLGYSYEICSIDIVQNVDVQCKRPMSMWGVGIFYSLFVILKAVLLQFVF